MSTTELAALGGSERARETSAQRPAVWPRAQTPIVPPGTISGRALMAVVAIMTFLACVTSSAVMLVRAAALDWQTDVGREVSIQIRPAPGRDMEADVATAAA